MAYVEYGIGDKMKYALVKNNIVESIFDHDGPASDFPDIKQYLREASDDTRCGWVLDKGSFKDPEILFPSDLPDVTPRQMRQALVISGVSMDQITQALSSLPEPTKSMAQIEWEYSLAFQRKRPIVESVRLVLGWTSKQVDDLWKLAATL